MKRLFLIATLLLASCTTQVEVKADPNGELVKANILLLRELKQTQEALLDVANQNRLIAAQNEYLKKHQEGAKLEVEKIPSY